MLCRRWAWLEHTSIGLYIYTNPRNTLLAGWFLAYNNCLCVAAQEEGIQSSPSRLVRMLPSVSLAAFNAQGFEACL